MAREAALLQSAGALMTAIMVWNPFMSTLKSRKESKVLFDSAAIPRRSSTWSWSPKRH